MLPRAAISAQPYRKFETPLRAAIMLPIRPSILAALLWQCLAVSSIETHRRQASPVQAVVEGDASVEFEKPLSSEPVQPKHAHTSHAKHHKHHHHKHHKSHKISDLPKEESTKELHAKDKVKPGMLMRSEPAMAGAEVEAAESAASDMDSDSMDTESKASQKVQGTEEQAAESGAEVADQAADQEMTGQGAEQESSLETGTESEDMQLNMGGAQACVGTLLEKCPTDKTDACKTQDAGTCVNVFHKCTSDKMVQCAVRKGKCASGGATCYLPCTGVELHGSSCAAQPVDNCNGGYITDGSSGMSCMVSTQDISKCANAGTCALAKS
ncbi:unnamed protein product [Effrenium voratum]|nr:unnamed protein product [Effrenium voratum]